MKTAHACFVSWRFCAADRLRRLSRPAQPGRLTDDDPSRAPADARVRSPPPLARRAEPRPRWRSRRPRRSHRSRGTTLITPDAMESFAASIKRELAVGGAELHADVADVVAATRDGSDASSVVVVDVRSPGEFAKGHIPGAVNVPLFTDEERASVGMCFAKRGRGPAMVLGMRAVRSKPTRCTAHRPRTTRPTRPRTRGHPARPGHRVRALLARRHALVQRHVAPPPRLAPGRARRARPPRRIQSVPKVGALAMDRPRRRRRHPTLLVLILSLVHILARHRRGSMRPSPRSPNRAPVEPRTNDRGKDKDKAGGTRRGHRGDRRGHRCGHRGTVARVPACASSAGARASERRASSPSRSRRAGIDLGVSRRQRQRVRWVGRPARQPTSEPPATSLRGSRLSPAPAWVFIEDEGPHVGRCSVDPSLFKACATPRSSSTSSRPSGCVANADADHASPERVPVRVAPGDDGERGEARGARGNARATGQRLREGSTPRSRRGCWSTTTGCTTAISGTRGWTGGRRAGEGGRKKKGEITKGGDGGATDEEGAGGGEDRGRARERNRAGGGRARRGDARGEILEATRAFDAEEEADSSREVSDD